MDESVGGSLEHPTVQLEEFRCRFAEGEPVLYEQIHTAFTYINQETGLFKVVNVEMTDTLEEYVISAAEKTERSCFLFPFRCIILL